MVCVTSFGSLWRCSACDSIRVVPPRSASALRLVHADPEYFDHPYFEARRRVEDDLRASRFDAILRDGFGGEPPDGAAVFDFGCDTGVFLEYAASRYELRVAGVEVAPKSVAVARDKGLDVTCGDIATLRVESKYDLVVLNDVLEHVADPLLVLQSVATILKPQGRLYLATPNAGALIYKVGEALFRMFGSMPLLEKLYVPYHEYYFSNRGLRTMVQAQSMTPVMHENREFPLDEFGHGRRLKVAVGGLFALQSVLRRPSLQILVAQKGLAG